MPPDVCFIVNPAAGHGRAQATWQRIEPIARSLGEFTVQFTEGPGHGRELARRAAREGYRRVVCLGGDGTLNEVGNGLMGTDTALGMIASGRGNDWIKTLGIPRDPEAACLVAFRGRLAPMDVGHWVGHRYFFNVAGFGFDAEVCRRVNNVPPALKAMGGKLYLAFGGLGTLLHFTGLKVRIDIDGEVVRADKLIMLAAGIGRYIGGGMMALPDAVVDDGLFDVLWGEDVGRLELIGLLGKIFKGEHMHHPKARFRRARRIAAEAERPIAVQVEGEVEMAQSITFDVVPSAIQVILPE